MTDILQDKVIRATDLNRASGEVLNKASRTPVTIVRDEETFALMRRDVAAGWRKEATCAAHLTELIWHALAHPDTIGPQFEWIGVFDEDDRRERVNELMNLYRKATRDGSWDDLDAAIHEWAESGWAALSSELANAFNAPSERTPLDKARAV